LPCANRDCRLRPRPNSQWITGSVAKGCKLCAGA
jgi:hypothetical protein